MKILALEKEIDGANWKNSDEVLKQEALHVYNIQKEGVIREIYFDENHCAVLILECINREKAQTIINELPLVKAGLITFDIKVLSPYNGFDRLI